jgi:hypothetical protein
MQTAPCRAVRRGIAAPPFRSTRVEVTVGLGLATALLGAALCVACPPASARGPARVSVSTLEGAGDWLINQDYGRGAGVRFTQHFSFAKHGARVAPIPLNGGTVKVLIRVHVDSAAAGAYTDVTGQLKAYTCSASSDSNAKATIQVTRRGSKFRITTMALTELNPGSPNCTEPGAAWWPTSTDLFTRALKTRNDVNPGALLQRIALQFPETTVDCGDPVTIGTCSEQLRWSGTLKLRHAS